MAQYGFYFDMTACGGCKTCQIACNDRNDLKPGTLFRRVKGFEGGKFPTPWIYYLSITCNHCKEPKCVEGCPTQAMHKLENGIVAHDKSKCIGCRYCTWSCPYGVPQFIEETGQVSKCDMCQNLVEKGENPACVDACTMRAIKWGELDELRAKYGADAVSDLPVLPSSAKTTPSVLIKPKTVALNKEFIVKED
ncbi:anaerobic dimethyl sulfoxide reductase subunit B (iron-sulfur subunit) [Desulfitobacterium sp. LBE]|uniref:4Fe-4S ferredoxin n=4 Tax=root TaxID=1 RepID=A0A098B7H4_DESHA|nr:MULTISPECIES: DMSO/selenate family reductase complex B subunit [Desulfitobacterium]ACL19336.1 dimethylsulfoxide reductase, chain B [Desulfitobacterium hafniense DCB-2]EHL09159.1 dimethylsulfoxide reductase, chain B [Desulfitobacterium hafniense DP7]KTE92556.1 4Fe-4S ferredoxin [Desulfitobacterium hafniense]MEA5021938.1 DMSO/selenate family reductase complex B subunit [Desulfitobacterium hafniense]TWH57810.1 anaerobic dimethyl sulfoxide reductase subunit B (iron-sulfur subunit) [Desulfitobac